MWLLYQYPRERGYALVLTLVILIIAGLLLGTLGLRIYFHKDQQVKSVENRIATINVLNALRHAVSSNENSASLTLNHQQAYAFQKQRFGFLQQIQLSGTCGDVEKRRIVLAGFHLPVDPNVRLELAASPYPISRGRGVTVDGVISVPEGTRVKLTDGALPIFYREEGQGLERTLDYSAFARICQKAQETDPNPSQLSIDEETFLQRGSFVWDGDLILDDRTARELKGPGRLQVTGTLRVTGSILIHRFLHIEAEKIILEDGVKMDACLLTARSIQSTGTTGNSQFIARESFISIKDTFSYGTIIGIPGTVQDGRFIGTLECSDSVVDGVLLMPLPKERQNPQFRSKFIRTTWEGLLYMDGETELVQTTVHGLMRTGLIRESGKYVPTYNKLESVTLRPSSKKWLLPTCMGERSGVVFNVVY